MTKTSLRTVFTTPVDPDPFCRAPLLPKASGMANQRSKLQIQEGILSNSLGNTDSLSVDHGT